MQIQTLFQCEEEILDGSVCHSQHTINYKGVLFCTFCILYTFGSTKCRFGLIDNPRMLWKTTSWTLLAKAKWTIRLAVIVLSNVCPANVVYPLQPVKSESGWVCKAAELEVQPVSLFVFVLAAHCGWRPAALQSCLGHGGNPEISWRYASL